MKSKYEIEDVVRDRASVMLMLVVVIVSLMAIIGVLVATERNLDRMAKVCQEACVKW